MQDALYCCVLLGIVASGCVSRVGPKHYQVFILAGQSNMDGRGKKDDLRAELSAWSKPQPDVLICYSNSTIRGPYSSGGWKPLEAGYSVPPGTREKLGPAYELPGTTFGPELSLGHTLADVMPDQHIALLKFSEGGTNLQKHWDPDNRDGLYPQFLRFIRQSLKTLSDNGDTYNIAAVVWHQGESDASLPEGKYQELLTALIKRMRADLGVADLPFVIGEVYDNGQRDRVRAGQLATSRAVPNVFFISAAGLHTSDNGTHFDSASQIELGRRMAEAIRRRGNVMTVQGHDAAPAR